MLPGIGYCCEQGDPPLIPLLPLPSFHAERRPFLLDAERKRLREGKMRPGLERRGCLEKPLPVSRRSGLRRESPRIPPCFTSNGRETPAFFFRRFKASHTSNHHVAERVKTGEEGAGVGDCRCRLFCFVVGAGRRYFCPCCRRSRSEEWKRLVAALATAAGGSRCSDKDMASGSARPESNSNDVKVSQRFPTSYIASRNSQKFISLAFNAGYNRTRGVRCPSCFLGILAKGKGSTVEPSPRGRCEVLILGDSGKGSQGRSSTKIRKRTASDHSEMNEVWSMDSPGTPSCLVGCSFPPTSLAGFPTAVVCGGTSISTTEPAPILAPTPIFTFPSIVAPAPISTPSPILGCRSPPTLPVPPNVTWWSIETLFPITAVSPTTTPVAWSKRMPFPILAAGWMSTAKTSEILD
nr:Uncharacterised protein [Ipomoea batatas]